jgi:four helix bundle protein
MRKLDDFGAYQKSLKLFDLVAEDMNTLADKHDLMRLRSQQYASADSICANMEEGSGRWSKSEFVQYLVISRGSAVETAGRYKRLRHWLPAGTILERGALCEEIIAILTTTINSMKRKIG